MANPPSPPGMLTQVGLPESRTTLIAFSHLRWDGVFQRPQHLLSRLAKNNHVIVWEEPEIDAELATGTLRRVRCERSGVTIVTPVLPDMEQSDRQQRALLDEMLAFDTQPLIRWYYTPMMLPFSAHLDAACTIYDCMDELSGFLNAPPELLLRETALFKAADLVFTGGASLYEAKRNRHENVHLFASSVDAKHFRGAREQRGARKTDVPVVGYCGVIDERLDLGLIADLAALRPDVRIEMAGPVVKIDPASLPQAPNLHWLGRMSYDDLPALMAGWDAALMPFALNEATRFISPTKTPEYLAAGLPVVSTPVTDVVRGYGKVSAVRIAVRSMFVAACDEALALAAEPESWLPEADRLLDQGSWDQTVASMQSLIAAKVAPKTISSSRIPQRTRYDVLVVGAGFAGSVMAERLANDAGKRVLVIDRRDHVAGNAYDRLDDAGIMIHQYGPHIFHTNSNDIVSYLSRFTKWRPYEHRVLAEVDGQQVPIPINRTTINALYNLSLETDEEAANFLAEQAEPVDKIETSADVVISAVGRELYGKFFQGYTRKQWGLDPSELDKSVTSRVPTRTNTDDRYFTDSFQAMPKDGYTRMFQNMLDSPLIEVCTGVEFADIAECIDYDHLVFTGPVDEYFGFRFGKLPYRSLSFDHRTLEIEQAQAVATVNYPDEAVPYTRITEYKHLTGQVSPRTSVTYEYPQAHGDPYYPIPRPENQALFKKYDALAAVTKNVSFVGRLATYRYYNMDQVVGQALATYRRLKPQLLGAANADSEDHAALA